mmetsp:Transcript_33211/g.72570  ORF Transcript_33211/g.72570 Transcript_33211/m.72570 type:complete len:244 (+) Transcript_33211:197-928(+)
MRRSKTPENQDDDADASPVVLGCHSMSGNYESGAAILDVHPEGVFIASSQGTSVAQGEIITDSDCKCSGDMMYGELGTFKYKYDAYTCTLSWYNIPSVENPSSGITNEWRKDAACATRPLCDPQVLREKQGLPPRHLDATALALNAQTAGMKLAHGLDLFAGAGKVVVVQSALAAQHNKGGPAVLGAAEAALAAFGTGRQAASDAYDGVAIINRAAARPCRMAMLAMIEYENFAKVHVAAMKG